MTAWISREVPDPRLLDRALLRATADRRQPGPFTVNDLAKAARWCHVSLVQLQTYALAKGYEVRP